MLPRSAGSRRHGNHSPRRRGTCRQGGRRLLLPRRFEATSAGTAALVSHHPDRVAQLRTEVRDGRATTRAALRCSRSDPWLSYRSVSTCRRGPARGRERTRYRATLSRLVCAQGRGEGAAQESWLSYLSTGALVIGWLLPCWPGRRGRSSSAGRGCVQVGCVEQQATDSTGARPSGTAISDGRPPVTAGAASPGSPAPGP